MLQNALNRGILTTSGHAHLHAMHADPQILGRNGAWQMSADTHDVPFRRRDTALHHRTTYPHLPFNRDLEAASALEA